MNNFIALVAIQGANALFPLLAFPLIMHHTGDGVFANLVTGEAWAILVMAFCLLGFDISGIKKIHSGDVGDVRNIFSLISVSRIVVFVLIFFISLFFNESAWFDYYIGFLLIPFGTILQSLYYFQANGSNNIPAFIIVPLRVIALLVIVACCFFDANPIIFSYVIGGSYLISGIICFSFIYKKIGFNNDVFNFYKIYCFIKKDLYTFLGNISVVFYRGLNVIIFSHFSSSTELVASYAMAEKFVKIVQSAVLPISNFFFPKTIKKIIEQEKINSIKIIWKDTRIQLVIVAILVFLIDVALILMKIKFPFVLKKEVIDLFLLMSLTPLFGVASFMVGFVGLNALSYERVFAKIVAVVGIFSILMVLFASIESNAWGVAVIYFLSEVMILVLSFIYLWNKVGR